MEDRRPHREGGRRSTREGGDLTPSLDLWGGNRTGDIETQPAASLTPMFDELFIISEFS